MKKLLVIVNDGVPYELYLLSLDFFVYSNTCYFDIFICLTNPYTILWGSYVITEEGCFFNMEQSVVVI